MMANSGLKICIVSSWVPSSRQPGFAPYVYNFAQNLGKFGLNVTLICPLERGDESVTKREFVTIYRINKKLSVFQIFRLIGKIRPDIIHVHAPNIFSCSAIVASKFSKIPIIATVHRAEIDKLGNPMFFFRKHVLARFNKIIAVSNYTKSLALKAGVDEKKIIVAYNSCDESFFYNADKIAARFRQNIPIDRKIVLFVGNLIKLKGVYTLIESIRILKSTVPKLLLLVIGQGEERERLESMVGRYHLENNIKFLGWLPQKDLPDIYNAADVFVLPSITEGHSIALLEAMSVGLPIVASKTGGNIESIEERENGLIFDSGDANKLAENLTLILTDSKLRNKMAEKNSILYNDKFSVKNQIKIHLSIYNSLLKNSASQK